MPMPAAHEPSLDFDHQRDVLARLKRIEGQLRGIRKMIEERGSVSRSSSSWRRPKPRSDA
jgi:hypothetical protein